MFQAILQLLFEVGSPELLLYDLASKLERYKTRHHQISRRILRMNKRLEIEFGERVAGKRGWHWVLTSFAFEFWESKE